MSSNVQRGYRFTREMAEALREYCEQNSVNEASFVRSAVAAKMAEQGIVVPHNIKHGGKRPRKNSKRGIFSRS